MDVRLQYDRQHDILYLDVGEPQAGYSEMVSDQVYLRINPVTDKVIGATIMGCRAVLQI